MQAEASTYTCTVCLREEYSIEDNFRGVPIFVVDFAVTKISPYEN